MKKIIIILLLSLGLKLHAQIKTPEKYYATIDTLAGPQNSFYTDIISNCIMKPNYDTKDSLIGIIDTDDDNQLNLYYHPNHAPIALPTRAPAFYKGSNIINVGVGFGYETKYLYANSNSFRVAPVFNFSFDHGMVKLGPGTLGLGAALSYQAAQANYTYGDTKQFLFHQCWNTTVVGLRSMWHPDFSLNNKIDFYGGIGVSYILYSYMEASNDPNFNASNYNSTHNSGLFLSLFVGGRYYITPVVGMFAEAGYDLSYLKVGFSFNLNNKKD